MPPVEMHCRDLKEVSGARKEGQHSDLHHLHSPLQSVFSALLPKGVSAVCSLISCLALICRSDETSYSLNFRLYAVFQTVSCYFWREQERILWVFFKQTLSTILDPQEKHRLPRKRP